MTPAVVVEAGIVHLLVPPGWLAVHVAHALAHATCSFGLLDWGFGSSARCWCSARSRPGRRAGLALPSDAPDELGTVLLRGAAPTGAARRDVLGVLGGLDLADAVHHALQPA